MEREQHSEDLQDIIGRPPHRLVQWGITYILLLILIMVVLSAFIRYPDIVQSTVRINTVDAPKVVPARNAGHLARILVQEGQTVTAGQQLAWIESTADHSLVLALQDSLYALRESLDLETNTPALIGTATAANLGELQGSY